MKIENNTNVDLAFIDSRNGAAGINILSVSSNDVLSTLANNSNITITNPDHYTVHRLFSYIFEVN